MNTSDTKSRRPRGTGSIYQQKGSTKWWLQYFRDGKPYRQSSGTSNRTKAEAMLRRKLAEIATHNFVDPKDEKRLVRDLFDALRLDYANNDLKSWADAEARWRLHLEPIFGSLRATNVTKRDLAQYQNDRKNQGASNATINRELAVLRRMFTLAEIVKPEGFFPHLEENNVRMGFLDDARYSKLATACAHHGLWLAALVEAGYQLGWRVGELLNLRVRNVDLAERILRLDPGTTKNNEGRTAIMPERLFLLIQQCVTGKKPDDFVFTRSDGKLVRDFRGVWAKVTTEAGVPDLLFHDLRRSAVRNMNRRGIPERVAMKITGHKTRSVFDRYNIVSESDLRDAANKMEQPIVENRHSSDIVERAVNPLTVN